MKIFGKKFSRDEYFNNQIKRSESKFSYCKVSYKHVEEWFKIINDLKIKKICCLGTRNGREVDIFRFIFGDFFLKKIVKYTEINRHGFNNLFPFLLNYKRSDIKCFSDDLDVYGVEINPQAQRKDTLISSFDELPEDWNNKFDLLYSNSFDQSMSPEKTAIEWKKILKNNGLIIFSFSYDKMPTESDPVGGLTFENVSKLFGGEVIYYDKSGSNYSDLILKISK